MEYTKDVWYVEFFFTYIVTYIEFHQTYPLKRLNNVLPNNNMVWAYSV